jgi:MinD-like ATPase involved in chromosome partitioning or flagellar assembly
MSPSVSSLTRYQPGLDMLLAPVTPGDAEKIPPRLVGEMLAILRSMYDFVVIDTPTQFSEHVLTAMDVSSQLVLLTTPDVPALKSLRVTLDMLDMLSYPRQIRSVVVNRADSKVGLSVEHVQKVVRCDIAALIPSSRAVPVSVNKGVPITLDSPGHPVSQAIAKFAQQRLLATSTARRSEGRARGKRRVA